MRQDSIGRTFLPIDGFEGGTYYGGKYNSAERTYFFRITQHIQKVIQNAYTSPSDLYLYVTDPFTNTIIPNRVVLFGTNPQGTNDGSNRFRLKLTYTVLD